MAQPDLDYGDATEDPKAQADVARVFADSAPAAPPPPPTQDHPMVQFAKGILRPMFYGAADAFGSGQTNLPEGNYTGPIDFGAAVNTLTRATRPDLNTGGAGSGNYGLGSMPDTAPAFDVPVLGGVLRQAKYAGAEGSPITDLGPIPFGSPEVTAAEQSVGALAGQVKNQVFGGAGGLLAGKAPQFATDAAGAGRADLGTGMPDRYVVNQGKTRSYVTDTLTGKDEPNTFTGKDHATQAQASADQLNASAQAVKTVAPPQMTGALSQIPDEVETAVRRMARAEPGMTADDMVGTPNLLGQLQLALAKAKLPASDENVLSLAQDLLAQEKARPTVGNQNYAKVTSAVADALGVKEQPPISFGEDIPRPINVPTSAEQAAAESGAATAAQQTQNDILQQAIAKKQAASVGGAMPPDLRLPSLEGASPKSLAVALVQGTMTAISDLPRAAMLIGHLPLVRQAAPLIADAVVRQNPVAAMRAIGRMMADTTGGVASERIFNNVLAGQRSLLEEAGIRPGMRYRGAADLLSESHGPLSATEEYGLRSIFGRSRIAGSAFGGAIGAAQGDTPEDHLRNALIGAGAGALTPNINRAFPAMLNSLRTGAAMDLARMQQQSRGFVKSDDIVHAVRIVSGKGDLPGGATTAKVLNGVFFGPRLATSSWQYPAEVLGSLKNIGGDIGRRPLNPSDIMMIRSATAYVATGIGIMKIANAFGLELEMNPDSKDFGRIILPDGSRVDVWSAFGPDARLIAQSINFVNQHVIQGRPVGPMEDTPWDMGTNYIRSKLNAGVPAAVGNVLAGKTMAGVPVHAPKSGQEVVDAVANPANWPQPLAVQEAQTAGGGGLGAAKVALVAAGAGVINTPRHINYDGLGVAEGQPTYNQSEIFNEYARLKTAEGKDPVMPPPPPKIGNGTKHELQLPTTEQDKYVQAVGQEREKQLGVLIYSQKYQDATQAQQQAMFTATQVKADRTAEERYLAQGIWTATDPVTVQLGAVNGFADQQNNKDRAYWVALLERAGRLTPDVVRAIDELKTVEPGQRTPLTVDEYRKAAPIVHQFLGHAPFGTDARPVGNQADWTAVEGAKVQQANERDRLIRAGMDPTQAHYVAQNEVMASLSPAQRGILINSAALENPQRRVMMQRYGTMLTRFLGPNPGTTQESEADYQNFPNR